MKLISKLLSKYVTHWWRWKHCACATNVTGGETPVVVL